MHDEVIMHDDVIFNILCSLLFVIFEFEILYNLQNFRILQYYFHYIIQQLMKMNIFFMQTQFISRNSRKSNSFEL